MDRLYRYDNSIQAFTPAFASEYLNGENIRIRSILEDAYGIFLMGTNGGGLNRFDNDTGNLSRIFAEDGLPDNVIYGILEDNEENLWMSTNLGLCKFKP